ncbi:MAG TPA: hypothetical protein EYN83_04320 [Nitrospinaceae bacterium]|nr:hypothetical protein [Nitrospinaceae bacterium]HIN87380.1 hypothetical protein [Nitrospinaceae bacterium]
MLLVFLSLATLSSCGGGLVTHMNKDSVSIQSRHLPAPAGQLQQPPTAFAFSTSHLFTTHISTPVFAHRQPLIGNGHATTSDT